MKEFIIWNKKWETGIRKIDEQHKHFVAILNKAYSLNEQGKDYKQIDTVLSDLTEYARIHFSTEEEYFNKTDYPDAQNHIEKHSVLLGTVLDFNTRFDAKENNSDLLMEFLIFLKSWLDQHLVTVDHKYIPWLKEHGIK
ncbi:MAG: bacteriohemerythrin [Candidatus Woesearchaeota archaeon]|jgi:hemerythrin-like metal-binding protein